MALLTDYLFYHIGEVSVTIVINNRIIAPIKYNSIIARVVKNIANITILAQYKIPCFSSVCHVTKINISNEKANIIKQNLPIIIPFNLESQAVCR